MTTVDRPLAPDPRKPVDAPRTGPVGRKPDVIVPLTSLRFVAALLVVLYHTDAVLKRGPGHNWPRLDVSEIGQTGVGLFFLLSGFLLAHVYGVIGDRATLYRFYTARFARIYPIYLAALLADLPRFLAGRVARHGVVEGTAGTAVALVAAIALLQAWLPALGGLDGPTWSLSNEAFFYLLYPVLARALLPRLGVRRALLVLVAAWAATQAGPLLWAAELRTGLGPGLDVLRVNPLLRLPEFVAGLALWRLWRGLGEMSRESRVRAASASGGIAVAAFVAVALVHPAIPEIVLNNGALLPVFCLMILWATMARDGVIRLLSSAPARILGEASYALYLLHIPLWSAIGAVAPVSTPVGYAAYLATTILVSIAACRWIERPARRGLLARYARWAVERTESSPHVRSVPHGDGSAGRGWWS